MQYCIIPKVNISVSQICFGAWQASGWSGSNDSEFKRLLELAIQRGINFIDTAEVYGKGHSENLVGQVIKNHPRDKIILASKLWAGNAAPHKVTKSLEESLKRLGTDYLDIYYYHWPSKNVPLKDTIYELQKLKEIGKIRAVGVCNWMEPEWQEFKDHNLIDILQPCYNLLWRGIEKSILPLCEKNQIAVFPYSPLAQGILAGKYLNPAEIPETKSDPRRVNILLNSENLATVTEIVNKLKSFALNYGQSLAAVSLNWLLSQNNVTGVIVGITKEAQLIDNLKALEFKLSPENLAELSEITASFALKHASYDTLWGWHPKK